MAKFNLNIKGNKAVLQRLKEISEEARKTLQDEIEASLFEIQAKAVSNVPVDTGVLKNSIRVDNSDVKNLRGEVVAGVHYAPYVEFGTGTLVDVPEGLEDYAWQFKGDDIRQVNLPPRPFLIPAWEGERVKLVENMNKELKKKMG